MSYLIMAEHVPRIHFLESPTLWRWIVGIESCIRSEWKKKVWTKKKKKTVSIKTKIVSDVSMYECIFQATQKKKNVCNRFLAALLVQK